MNDEQRRLARFRAQPEGMGPFSRPPALHPKGTLQLTWVRQVRGDRCALVDEKMATVAVI